MTTVDFYATSAAGRDFSLHGGLSGVATEAMELLRKAIHAGTVTRADDPGMSVGATAVPGQALRNLLEPLRSVEFVDSPYTHHPAFANGAELLAYIDPDDVYDVAAIDF